MLSVVRGCGGCDLWTVILVLLCGLIDVDLNVDIGTDVDIDVDIDL